MTDLVSFSIGYLTPFLSIKVGIRALLAFTYKLTHFQIFCVYAAVIITFMYLYQITFLAAIMSLTSLRESLNRHCLTLRPVKAKIKPHRCGDLGKHGTHC